MDECSRVKEKVLDLVIEWNEQDEEDDDYEGFSNLGEWRFDGEWAPAIYIYGGLGSLASTTRCLVIVYHTW